MADTQLKLTRNQLASFLKGDHELIKQFENLFTVVEAIAPDFVNEVLIAAENASSRSTEALNKIEQTRKNHEVLIWLSMQ